jgi:hypothetical protein
MVQQATMQSQRKADVCKFGVRLPHGRAEAFAFDAMHGGTKWQDAVKLMLDQLDEHNKFIDKGEQAYGPNGFKRINCHFVFDGKQDLRHKALFVAGGHMTAPPADSLHSGVMSLQSMQLVALLAELNGVEMQAAQVGAACLEAATSETHASLPAQSLGSKLVIRWLSTRLCIDQGPAEQDGERRLLMFSALKDSSHVAQTHVCGCETQETHGNVSACVLPI